VINGRKKRKELIDAAKLLDENETPPAQGTGVPGAHLRQGGQYLCFQWSLLTQLQELVR